MKRWLLAGLYLAAAVLLLFYRGSIAVWLEADGSWLHFVGVLLIGFIIALVPGIPYSVVAVLLGAKYGPVMGTIINLALSAGAAVVLFLIVRNSFTPEQRRKAAGMRGVFRLTVFAERDPFMAVLFARLLPIAPAQAINIYSALTRMRLLPYAIATVLGKIPFLLTMTVLGHDFFKTRQWNSVSLTVGIYAAFLCSVLVVYKKTSKH